MDGKLYGAFDAADWRRALGIEEADVPHGLILHGEWRPHENLERWEEILGPDAGSPRWNARVGRHDGTRIGFMNVLGSGMASVAAHPFGVMGTRNIVQTGYFGGLSTEVEYGDILIVEEALGESLPRRYRDDEGRVESDPELLEAAVDYCEEHGLDHRVGAVRSTDALCLQTPELIEEWAEEGFAGVDMETATTYAMAETTGRRSIAILNLSDHLRRKDTFYNYTDERSETLKTVDEAIRDMALHLATLE